MLLKTSSSDKNSSFLSNNGKGKGKARSISSRIHRKTLKVASKPTGSSAGKRVPIGKRISLGKNQKNIYASFPPTTSSSLCDNSNDSGLGFDNHESQNVLHHQTTCSSSNNSQILALTNGCSSSNKNSVNYNNSSNYQQRSLNTIRYGEITQNTYISSAGRIKQATQEVSMIGKKHQTGLGVGKKIKSIINKPILTAKMCTTSTSNHMTLKNETEDTCGDDFFSTHIQKSNDSSKTISSPKKNGSFSPDKSLSSNSSPLTQSSNSDRSSPEISNDESKHLVTNASVSENSIDEGILSLPNITSSTTLLNQNLVATSRNGGVQLQIITQPEQQHRARYQTEGSRGAVKDKSGNGFPVVKLNGYNKPTILQVFIGNDVGRVSPHIFYQACKVSGKNSTPCNEVKIEGTMIIEIEIKPENDMTVVCDCVGILKERNVDVEHRLGKNHTFASSTVTRNKKKSTKCRMIFRTKINEDTEYPEILQICSNTITCTQPPGVPEICKKSLDSCSVLGGKELFIIGKNFLKDTKVSFVRYDETKPSKKIWEEIVLPDKEYLQQAHLICTVPAFPNADEVVDPIQVQIYVMSSSKKSEPHNFIYLPLKKFRSIPHSPTIDLSNIVFTNNKSSSDSITSPSASQIHGVLSLNWNDGSTVSAESIMAPPTSLSTLTQKPSFSKSLSDPNSNESKLNLKTEYIDPIQSSNDLQEPSTSSSSTSTSSPSVANIQPSTSVKEMMYNDNTLIAVANGQCFVTPNSSALIGPASTPVQVEQALLNEFQVNTSATLDLHHIKNEQNADIQAVAGAAVAAVPSSAMLPPIAPPPSVQQQPDLSTAQQQQVVENFLNMICAQVEPTTIVPQAQDIINHQHIHHDLVLNSNLTNPGVVGVNIQTDHPTNMCAMNTQSPMMCEQNLLQIDGTIRMNTLESTIEASSSVESASSLISNAVSDATAETQAVVKQMIASVTAELLSENPVETQSNITNFISSTLVNDMVQAVSTEQAQQAQQQISDSQQQQLQEIIAQELLTPVMIKKEDNNGQTQNVSDNLINVSGATNTTANNINQPFSPTPADFNLTAMSESDLISFINPSVFM